MGALVSTGAPILIDSHKMKIARYWTRAQGEAVRRDGERIHVTARGWSNQSISAALELARQSAGRLASALASGDPKLKHYLYGERPLAEPVLQEFRADGAEPAAVVTRNSYGVLVLNTRDLLFADIDREDQPARTAAGGGLLSGVFSFFAKPAPPQAPPPSSVIEDIRRVADRHNLGVRVYKTAGGFRALVVGDSYEPASASTESLLKEFGSDPLYVRLCRMQESFRARLTPKPWRCGMRVPPVSFPFLAAEEESRFREWQQKYESKAARYATCHFLAAFGPLPSSSAAELVAYHDEQTRAGSGLPLA